LSSNQDHCGVVALDRQPQRQALALDVGVDALGAAFFGEGDVLVESAQCRCSRVGPALGLDLSFHRMADQKRPELDVARVIGRVERIGGRGFLFLLVPPGQKWGGNGFAQVVDVDAGQSVLLDRHRRPESGWLKSNP